MRNSKSTLLAVLTVILILFTTNYPLAHGVAKESSLSSGPDVNGIIYVKQGGSGDGSSWANATGDLQGAIDAAGVTEVWVAKGTYQPVSGTSFSMKAGVKIYGGFPDNNNAATMNDRDWVANTTSLKGNDNSVIYNDDNNLTVDAVLDGFTITDGNANAGGGMYNSNVAPAFVNLIITGNESTYGGGGMYNDNSSPILTNVTISSNTDRYFGGGMYNDNSSPILTNVAITNNKTLNYFGGGMYNDNSSPILTNVTITNNTSPSNGGGVYSNSPLILYNTIVVGNSSGIINTNGGGVYLRSPLILYNTIVVGNSSGIINASGGGSLDGSSSNNLIQVGDNTSGGTADGTGTAIDNTTPSDIFVDFANRDYSLKDGSYVINKGSNQAYIDAGRDVNNDKDLSGNPRLAGSAIDLGAYESQIVLPIRLSRFDAVRRSDDALLIWSTATESNNRGFFVEHSTDGGVWASLAFISSKALQGNSTAVLSYDYLHPYPGSGTHYYRLKQTDFDGHSSFSDVKTVTFGTHLQISLYPNPASSSVTVNGLENGDYKMNLLNSNGQSVGKYKVKNKSRYSIRLTSLAAGVYYLQITKTDGTVVNRKVVKK